MKRIFGVLLTLLLLGCCGRLTVRAEAFPEDSRPETEACSSGEAWQEEPELYRELATDDWFPLLTAAFIGGAAAAAVLILWLRRKRR